MPRTRPVFSLLLAAILFTPHLAAQTVFRTVVDQGQNVPQTGSPETGAGIFFFDPATRTLAYDITITGTTGGFSFAHIHLGEPGVNGAIQAFLFGTSTHFAGSTVLSNANVANLVNGDLYCNFHSLAIPNGEIRGQIVPGLVQFNAVLSDAKEVPPTGTGASGDGSIVIHPDNRVTYQVEFAGLGSDVTVAHLHGGKTGASGAPIAPLTLVTPAGTSGTFAGTTAPLSDVDIARIRAGHAYVDVHSVNFPLGEMRGQIVPSFDAYGAGCNGSAVLSGSGRTRPGGAIALTVAGGPPHAAPGLLLLSLEGDTFTAQNGCSLHVGGPITVRGVAPLDGAGSLTIPAVIPAGIGPLAAPLVVQLQYFGKDQSQTGGFFNTNGLTLFIDD